MSEPEAPISQARQEPVAGPAAPGFDQPSVENPPIRPPSPQGSVVSETTNPELLEDLNYQNKMQKVLETLNMTLPEDPDAFRVPVYLKEPKSRRPLTVMPLSESVDQHFVKAWKGATKAEEYKWSEDLTPPQNGMKVGKRSFPIPQPKIKHYELSHSKLPELKPEWPFSKVNLDSNVSLLNPVKPNSGWDPKLDDWMDANGRMLKMLNQVIMVSQASTSLLKDLTPDPDDEESQTAWSSMADFTDVANTTLQHMASVATNLQVNLLLAKRDEVLLSTDLSEEYKQVLRYSSPKDKENRLFSGQLYTFDAAKAKIEQHKLTTQLVSQNRKRPSSYSDTSANKKKPRTESYPSQRSGNTSSYNQPFRDQPSDRHRKGGIRKKGKFTANKPSSSHSKPYPNSSRQ